MAVIALVVLFQIVTGCLRGLTVLRMTRVPWAEIPALIGVGLLLWGLQAGRIQQLNGRPLPPDAFTVLAFGLVLGGWFAVSARLYQLLNLGQNVPLEE